MSLAFRKQKICFFTLFGVPVGSMWGYLLGNFWSLFGPFWCPGRAPRFFVTPGGYFGLLGGSLNFRKPKSMHFYVVFDVQKELRGTSAQL